jgi:hypothetical protein
MFICYGSSTRFLKGRFRRAEDITWHVRDHADFGYRSFASVQRCELRLFPISDIVPTDVEDSGWGGWPGRETAILREYERQLELAIPCYFGEVVNLPARITSIVSQALPAVSAIQESVLAAAEAHRELEALRKAEAEQLQRERQERDRQLRAEEEARQKLIRTEYWRLMHLRLDK